MVPTTAHERVLLEKKELEEKLQKLYAFRNDNPAFPKLSFGAQKRLIKQMVIMECYVEVLGSRLEEDFGG